MTMFYLRAPLVVIWALFVLIAIAIRLLFRPWDPDTDRIFLQWLRKGVQVIVPLKIEVEGSEYLGIHRPCILAANHQHILDALPISEVFPHNTVATGKIEIRTIPLLGWVFDRAGNVWLDRSNQQTAIASLQDAGERMQHQKINLWIFPEGRLNQNEKDLQPFKKGAFHTAIQLGIPIVPVVFSPSYFLNLERRRLHPGKIWIRVLEPILTSELGKENVDALLADTYERMNQAYLELESLALPNDYDQKHSASSLAPTHEPHSIHE